MTIARRLLILLAPLCLAAQPPAGAGAPSKEDQLPPLPLEELLDFVSTPSVLKDTAMVRDLFQRSDIAFTLNQTSLVRILEAARTGKQPDEITASVILESLRACVGCRDAYFGPLTMEELISLVSRSLPPQQLIEEVRLRGTKDIPKTQASISRLRAANAPPGLTSLVVPDHELEIPPPDGYKRFDLQRSPSFSATAKVGRLEIDVDVSGKAELLFVNNTLFARALDEADKKIPQATVADLGCSFTAPGPFSEVEFSLESVERQEANKGKMASIRAAGKLIGRAKDPVAVKLEPNLVVGRHGFRITIDESDRKQPHTYKLILQWDRPAN